MGSKKFVPPLIRVHMDAQTGKGRLGWKGQLLCLSVAYLDSVSSTCVHSGRFLVLGCGTSCAGMLVAYPDPLGAWISESLSVHAMALRLIPYESTPPRVMGYG